jgi:signal peptidase II
LTVLVADIATKRIVTATMSLHEVRRVFGDYARLTYIHNPGAAFGLFPGSRWPLIGISLVAIVVVITVAWRHQTRRSTLIPLALILGGAIGNLIDRVRLGEVVDFIQIGIPPHYWPVFNAADSAVSIGVVWLAIGLLLSDSKHEEPVYAVAPSRDDG